MSHLALGALAAVLLAIMFPIQIMIHELAHAAVLKLFGCDVSIRLFPGYVDGYWRWGYIEWTEPPGLTDNHRRLVVIAPRIFDLWLIAHVGMYTAWFSHACILFVILKSYQAAVAVDFSYNTLGIFRSPETANDAWGTVKGFWPNTNVALIRVVSVLLVVAVMVACAQHIIW